MLFTRTIRRMMVCGLAMVLFMMIGLLLSAIYSHLSYRQIFRQLDYALDERPQKAEILEAIVKLETPLVMDVLPSQKARLQQHEFLRELKAAEAKTDAFILAVSPHAEFELSSMSIGKDCAVQLRLELADLESAAARIVEPQTRDAALASAVHQIVLLRQRALGLPDVQPAINATFKDARILFGRGFWLVVGSGALAVLWLCGLIVYGYVWVFSPLRKLHQGALRVAQGDFNYRLVFSRQDEMKELADAFNSMTSRFQEIRGDLDRQVCERIKQLIRSERLAGIGFLAAGVAHEINNPLSAIAMAAESLADRCADPREIADENHVEITRQYLDMIQREAFRCQRITQKLLDFARGNNETCTYHDLTAIVNDVLGVVRHISRYSDRTIHFRQTAPCRLEINGPEIQQVLMNLVSNGLEAMDPGGTMTIEITEQTDAVTLIVTDDGCGMTTDVIDNLFEPFFTQRRNGRGTGLGLSISHRIVADHGGSIDVQSDGPGRGSTFRVRLPRRARHNAAA